jgi:hypothetical protein
MSQAKLAGRVGPRQCVSPDGVTYQIDMLNKFCEEHDLNAGEMSQVIAGKIAQHKGWTA